MSVLGRCAIIRLVSLSFWSFRMKKYFKIAGISLLGLVGLVIVGAIIIAIFAPGLPILIMAKANVKSLDVRLQEFNSDATLTHAKEVAMPDYNFYVPSSCEKTEKETLWIYEDKTIGFSAIVFLNYSDVNVASAYADPNDQAYLLKYFKGNIPKNSYDFWKYQYSLNSDDFILSDAKQCVFCYSIVIIRDLGLHPRDKIFNYERDNIRGFIIDQDIYNGKGLIAFQFYCTDNLSKQYQICFKKMDDHNLIYGTINSVQFTK
jgi:hypothetical protein